MTVRWIEIPQHVSEQSYIEGHEVRRFKLYGIFTPSTAQGYAIAASPAIVAQASGILYRQDVKLSQTAFDAWDVEVPYDREKSIVGEWTWNFDTTGGTVHLTTSKQTLHKYKRADVTESIPDHKGSIDVQDSEVRGIDIVIPTMKFNVSYRHPSGVITTAYARYLQSLTGLVNSTPMLGWGPYEVLFLGATGSDGTTSDAEVGYQFAMSTSATNLSIGGLTWKDASGNTVPIVKEGWNPIWITYEDNVDNSNPIKKPKFVYIERVYNTVDMAAALGFGF